MEFPFVKVYDNVLHPDNCKMIIQAFEKTKDEYIERNIDDYIKFTEINFNKSHKWDKVVQNLLSVCNTYYAAYKAEFNIDWLQFPESYGFEEFRMKRYFPNDHDEFKLHVDVNDYESSRRYLSYLFYLNDVDEGGETTFGREDEVVIKPKAGRLLMFPPLWTYLHTGKKPISGTKYILTTYNTYHT